MVLFFILVNLICRVLLMIQAQNGIVNQNWDGLYFRSIGFDQVSKFEKGFCDLQSNTGIKNGCSWRRMTLRQLVELLIVSGRSRTSSTRLVVTLAVVVNIPTKALEGTKC